MTDIPPLLNWLGGKPAVLKRGPLAIILIEDDAAVPETLRHHLKLGFRHILALSPEPVPLPEDIAANVTNLRWNTREPTHVPQALNAVIAAVPPGTWLYYGYNAEFLFYPFAETRSVSELLAFHAEERREAMLGYVIDLYSPDLSRDRNAVSLSDAMFDRSGYFALACEEPDGTPVERQLDFHGGLRWRFEEHIPTAAQTINRIPLFQAAPTLRIDHTHRFNISEYNTYACPWHNNLTCAVASFRAAKALARNPGSKDAIANFCWRGSEPFRWDSQQLMDLGLMEPGQWF